MEVLESLRICDAQIYLFQSICLLGKGKDGII